MNNYALIGEKLSHSISPFIHENLFKLYNYKADYSIMEIPRDCFDKKVQSLKSLSGFNITIPYKTDIIRHLAEISTVAKDIGAVNTVAVRDGKFYGHNTDYDGFVVSLENANIPLSGRVLVLGSGGFARMAIYAACKNGCEVFINSIEPDTANKVKNDMQSIFPDAKIEVLSDISKLDDLNLIVNGTPVGMSGFDTENLPVCKEVLIKSKAYFDAIYNPLKTKTLRLAKENGLAVLSGLDMLVWQAVYAQKFWNGIDFNPADIKKLTDLAKNEL